MNRNDFVLVAKTVHANALEEVSYMCLNIGLGGKYCPFY